ncbi:MAG: penicillin-binding protein 2 [Acidithiobacillus sp.]|uniref:penicillin-binding protein 2 n=1 Tax=Acidithiobacillus sp. TaxID=1872118 RepID=UPI003D01D968
MQIRRRERAFFTSRLLFIAALIGVMSLVLLARILYLQVQAHERYVLQSDRNTLAVLPLAPVRGKILDRQGRVLADNRLEYVLTLTPDSVADIGETIAALRTVLPISDEDYRAFLRNRRGTHAYQAVVLRRNLNATELARFALVKGSFPGVQIETHWQRVYPYGPSFAHVVGYVGRPDSRDLEQDPTLARSGLDQVGKSGLEAQYEDLLRGVSGVQEVEVNARGQSVGSFEERPARAGTDLHTTLDLDLQTAAAAAMAGHSGAVVAVDPRNGAVLAAYSAPSYDPNDFVKGLDGAQWQSLRDDPLHPLNNRFAAGNYPPGSTIKPFVALVALRDGAIQPDETLAGGGYFQIPGTQHRYYDWRPGGHGRQDLRAAIRDSNDVFFYQLALRLGPTRLAQGLEDLGFGNSTAIDLPGEARGLVPSPAWMRTRRGQSHWHTGQTVMMGIGQGYLLATPLQLVRATAAIAADGQLPDLHLRADRPVLTRTVAASPRHMQLVEEAMRAVVQHGTAHILASDPHDIAGKTGTAQVRRAERDAVGRVRKGSDSRHLRDHALFIAYAPASHPQIAVAVIVEHGGHGGSAAAPVAQAVIDRYLDRDSTAQP